MKLIFMGTPEIAKVMLEAVIFEHDVLAVVTQPDRASARGLKLSYSPIKIFALEQGIEILQPETLKDISVIDKLKEFNPDVIVVVAYGKILPKSILDIPKYGSINLHTSLLPKYRGPAPIHAPILNGDNFSGVTVMYMNEKTDEGDIILQKKVEVSEQDNYGTLFKKLVLAGKDLLKKALISIENSEVVRQVQNHDEATYTKLIQKEDSLIDWTKDMVHIFNQVRAYNPIQPAYSFVNGKRLHIYEVEKVFNNNRGNYGEVLELIKGKGALIKVSDGAIIIKSAKPENKKLMSGADIINGGILKLGDILN